MRIPKKIERRIQTNLNRHFDRNSAMALASERRALDYLIGAERTYLDEISKAKYMGYNLTESSLQPILSDLEQTRAEIESVLMRDADRWAQDATISAYAEGRSTVGLTLHEMALYNGNVRAMEIAFSNFSYDKNLNAVMAGEKALAKNAFTTWNKETADWLGDEFVRGAREGIPIGNYADIANGRDSLASRLAKEPGRLRGRIIDTVNGPRHYPAELTSLNLARIEQTRIENIAAETEAASIGLTYCYNGNPSDVNTTTVCRKATESGVLPVEQMKLKHGTPPRLDKQYHLCRSILVYVRPEWVN